jgi:hypothetical protein
VRKHLSGDLAADDLGEPGDHGRHAHPVESGGGGVADRLLPVLCRRQQRRDGARVVEGAGGVGGRPPHLGVVAAEVADHRLDYPRVAEQPGGADEPRGHGAVLERAEHAVGHARAQPSENRLRGRLGVRARRVS